MPLDGAEHCLAVIERVFEFQAREQGGDGRGGDGRGGDVTLLCLCVAVLRVLVFNRRLVGFV